MVVTARDCFATLAMTEKSRHDKQPVIARRLLLADEAIRNQLVIEEIATASEGRLAMTKGGGW